MKTSLRKFKGFGLHRHEAKDRVDLRPLAQLDELAQASRVFLFLYISFFFFASTLCLLGDELRN